jgi:ATP-dependent DNA helicase RecG
MDSALARLPAIPEWQDEAWTAREKFPDFNSALRHLHRPNQPGDILPENASWTRLAYDELLAGQLALALVRAHMRRQPGRGSASEGRLRARILKALPYTLTHSQQKALEITTISLCRNACSACCKAMSAPARRWWRWSPPPP